MAALTAPLPVKSYIMRANIKAYPCLATGQASSPPALELNRRIDGAIDQFAPQSGWRWPDLAFLRRQKDDPGRINPRSREAADHSFNFLAAVAFSTANSASPVRNERWNDPEGARRDGTTRNRGRSDLERALARQLPVPDEAKSDDGRVFVADVPDPPGFSRHGLDAGGRDGKFNAVTAAHLDAPSRARIIDAVMALDRSPSCADLSAALAAAGNKACSRP